MNNYIKPRHPQIACWSFTQDDKAACELADAMAKEAFKNNMDVDDFRRAFKFTLRMLNSKSPWIN